VPQPSATRPHGERVDSKTPRAALPRARPPPTRLGLAALGSQCLQIRPTGRALPARWGFGVLHPARPELGGSSSWDGRGESCGYRWITVQVRVRVTPSTTWMRKTTSRPS
jgi:hypothetical protein